MSLNSIRIETDHCFWNDLFNKEEIEEIISYCEKFEKIIATTNNPKNINEKVRKTNIAWIHRNNESDWIFSRIEDAVNKLNSKFFGFDIDHLDVLQYTVYDEEGSHYKWHWDCNIGIDLNTIITQKQRKVSAVIQLSDTSEYEGGDLELSPCGSHVTIEKQLGMMSVFPSFVLHRVTPIKSGIRRTLVAWFTGPDWR